MGIPDKNIDEFGKGYNRSVARPKVLPSQLVNEKHDNSTVKPHYYGHQGDRNKCPHYRGVRFREVGFIRISVSQGPSELSVIERCPYYRGVRKERFHCTFKLKWLTSVPVFRPKQLKYHTVLCCHTTDIAYKGE